MANITKRGTGQHAEWDGDAIVVQSTWPGYDFSPERYEPRDDGRYSLGHRYWDWVPVPTPADDAKHPWSIPESHKGELPVTMFFHHDGTDPAFPALIADGASGAAFRPEVVQVVMDWINAENAARPDIVRERARWDGNAVVTTDNSGQETERYELGSDEDGRYALRVLGWGWESWDPQPQSRKSD